MSLALSILRLITDFSNNSYFLELKKNTVSSMMDFLLSTRLTSFLAFPIYLLKREPAVQHLEPKGRRVKGVFLALQVLQVCHTLLSLTTLYCIYTVDTDECESAIT